MAAETFAWKPWIFRTHTAQHHPHWLIIPVL
jgi:hypothetical protein